MSEAMGSGTEVYVRLLGEGTMVYRPTIGMLQREDVYRLSATAGYDVEDENWEFPPGTLVRCALRLLDDEARLVAVEAASST